MQTDLYTCIRQLADVAENVYSSEDCY